MDSLLDPFHWFDGKPTIPLSRFSLFWFLSFFPLSPFALEWISRVHWYNRSYCFWTQREIVTEKEKDTNPLWLLLSFGYILHLLPFRRGRERERGREEMKVSPSLLLSHPEWVASTVVLGGPSNKAIMIWLPIDFPSLSPSPSITAPITSSERNTFL